MAMPLQRLGSDTVAGPGYSLMSANNYTNYSGPITAVSNTFTVEFWVNPSPWNHEIDLESTTGYSGNNGQNFVWYPAYGGDVNEAAVGISVGLNGISVYEHGGNYMPALLVWTGTVSSWTHVAVVYENRQPRLYVNGVLVHTGLTSLRTHVYPSMYFPGGSYSNAVLSQLDDIRVWGIARTGAQIAAGMNGEVAGSSANLVAYWPMNEGSGEVLQDVTGNGYDVNLYPAGYPIAWWQSGVPGISPVAANKYRYAFNGKEKDQDIGEDDYDFGARIYDGRVGRWLSVDPLQQIYPSITPYSLALNSPLMLFDVGGKWVAKVDYNSATKKYGLSFSAEKGDNLASLAMQLGIPKASLVKADPSLNKLKIVTGTELKLSKLSEVNNINYAINFLAQKQEGQPSEERWNNCANFANMASGNKSGLGRSVDNSENIYDMIERMRQPGDDGPATPQFSPVKTDANAKIGDVMYYQAIDAEGEVRDLHFTIVILKDKTGKKIIGVMQKNGQRDLNKKVFDPNSLTIPDSDPAIPYNRKTTSGSSIFRPKSTEFKNQNELNEAVPPANSNLATESKGEEKKN